jgi:hypothetical protein
MACLVRRVGKIIPDRVAGDKVRCVRSWRFRHGCSRGPLAVVLERIAVKRVSTVTEEVKQAVREYIERNGEKMGDGK